MTRPAARKGAGDDAAGKAWYRITNRADTAEVYLYDEIGAWGISAGEFVKELKAVSAPTIELHINSPGGEVFDGLAIYNALKAHPARVEVTVDALAASAASFVAMAGDSVTMARNAQIYIHDGHGICVGNAKDMTALAALLDKCSDSIADIYAARAGGTSADWRERMRAESWYSADEAVSAGLADRVAEVKPAKNAPPVNTWDLSIFNHRPEVPDPTPAQEIPPEQPQQAPEDPADEPGFLMPDIGEPIRALAEIPFDADLFRAAVNLVATDCPAPDPAPPDPGPPEPELFSIDVPGIRRAIREARL